MSAKTGNCIGVPAPERATERQVAGIGNVVELRIFNRDIFRRNHELPQTQCNRMLRIGSTHTRQKAQLITQSSGKSCRLSIVLVSGARQIRHAYPVCISAVGSSKQVVIPGQVHDFCLQTGWQNTNKEEQQEGTFAAMTQIQSLQLVLKE